MVTLIETINTLDEILPRTQANCRNKDYKAIQYTSNSLLTVSIDNETISTNIAKIILYDNTTTIKMLLLTPHLVKYIFELEDIETITITTTE